MIPDYYALLGVAADADQTGIRAAYRVLAKQHHPDVAGSDNAQSTENFLKVTEAYEVLSDQARRTQYDFLRLQQDELYRTYQAAMEKARQAARDRAQQHFGPAAGRGGTAPRPSPPQAPGLVARLKSGNRADLLLWCGGMVAVVIVTGSIVWRQHMHQPIAVVYHATPPEPPSPSRLQSAIGASPAWKSLVQEEADLRRRAQLSLPLDKDGPARPQALAVTARPNAGQPQSEGQSSAVICTGEARTFSVSRQEGVVSVSYNGAAPVNPTIEEQASGLVVLGKIGPKGRTSLVFMKGDKDRTIVIISDAVGNVFRTFGVECSAAAF